MGNGIVYLRLQGVLQSWGERGRWGVRDTAMYPTKSGVIGLIGAAMGINDERLVKFSANTQMGIRVDKPGVPLCDYHTITTGAWMAAGGIKRAKGESTTQQSYRWYLQDASFLVAIQGERSMIQAFAKALQKPKWFLSLGRRSCLPATPIFSGVSDPDDDLLASLRNDGNYAYEIEDRQGNTMRMDQIVSVAHRAFAPRFVNRFDLEY